MLTLKDYEIAQKMPKAGDKSDRLREYRSRVPAGESGDWSVEKYQVELDLPNLRMMRDGRGTVPGTYTKLCRRGKIIMSDTDAEIGDLMSFFHRVRGRVLIHGLGLGVAVQGALKASRVTHVDVVELSHDVIRLVSPSFSDDRLNIHQGDCRNFKWPRGMKWDVVWHDIWDDICGDNKPEMASLKRSFARRCNWQHCWAEEWIR